MTALEYLKQPMKYQTFLGGGMFSSETITMKLLSGLEKAKQAKAKELNRARRDLADTRTLVNEDTDTQDGAE